MINYTILSEEIEEEYLAYKKEPSRNMDVMYEKLFLYLKHFVSMLISKNGFTDWNAVEDIVQETLFVIARTGINSFEKGDAKFSTYCAAIAKKKTIDWIRRQVRCQEVQETDFEVFDSQMTEEKDGNPEQRMLLCEQQLEVSAMMKKYLKMLMDWPQKPYRTVSCCFAMILFHRYHPKTTELSSPGWAFEELKKSMVEEGADRFLIEMQEWFPKMTFLWGDEFIDGMDEIEEGIYISEIVFGERFKKKDFENWCHRLRSKIKKQLYEAEKEMLCF